MYDGIRQRLLNTVSFIIPGGFTLRPWIQRLRGVRIGSNVWISRYVYFDELHPEQLSIGNNCTIGLRCSLISHFYWGHRGKDSRAGPVVIENDVFIGPHCIVLPNVTIGRGAVVQAGTVVSRNVPPLTLWGTVKAGPLAHVSVALTPTATHERFLQGLRPLRHYKTQHRRTGA